jgi:hypothetical protein
MNVKVQLMVYREESVQNPGSNLHVSGLAKVIDQRYLEDLFNKHGKVSRPGQLTLMRVGPKSRHHARSSYS